MPIQFDKFEQSKVDRLKTHLEMMAAKGQAKYFEIFVDSLKAVPKTDEPKEFEGYEDYMNPDSEQIKIVIYNSGSSPRNDQYVFSLKAQNREEAMNLGLSGMPIKAFTTKTISAWRDRSIQKTAEGVQIQVLKRENAELRDIIKDKEDEIDRLSDVVITARENGNKLGGIHLGDIMSVALEGIVRRNTHLISQIPGASGLAGIIEQDNERVQSPEQGQPDSEVTFKKKGQAESTPEFNQEEKEFVNFFRELRTHFNEDEMGLVIEILEQLSKDKSHLSTVVELLQENES